VRAALCLPGIVGWSGTDDSQASSPALKVSTVTPFMSLMSLGTRLNSLAPFTWRDDSLAFLKDRDTVEDGPVARGQSSVQTIVSADNCQRDKCQGGHLSTANYFKTYYVWYHWKCPDIQVVNLHQMW
jgi:hypothetical protein